jgi:hypothetical protein
MICAMSGLSEADSLKMEDKKCQAIKLQLSLKTERK